MRRFTAFSLAFLLLFAMTGCGKLREQDPYRTDTVIYIPADPTEPATEMVTEAEAEQETELDITEENVTETTGKSSSSSGKPQPIATD